MKCCLNMIRNKYIKKPGITYCRGCGDQMNFHLLWVWLQIGPAILGISVANCFFGTCLKEPASYSRDTCSDTFIATLFTIPRKWKQSKRPSIDEWIAEMWHICTTESHSAVKKYEIKNFAGKWIEFKKYHIKWCNPGPERQTYYVLPHMRFLALNHHQIWNVMHIS